MPSMYEIYEKHAYEYDELIDCEDYQNNVKKYLNDNIGFSGKSVIELGAGTGRLTKMYANHADFVQIYDRSQHMIEKAKINLKNMDTSIEYNLEDNLSISNIKAKVDVVLEGWSFGHTVSDNVDKIDNIVDEIVSDSLELLNVNGFLIIIESLGTNFNEPKAPTESLGKFYRLLENKYNFEKTVLRTDYKFKTNEEAKRITSYFFGNDFGKYLKFEEEGIVKEFTGVWTLTKR